MEHICSLCRRQVNTITLHHLIPREEGGKFSEKVPLCQPCHSTVHNTFTNKELAAYFHTIPRLLKSGRLDKFLNWIRKQTTERISNR